MDGIFWICGFEVFTMINDFQSVNDLIPNLLYLWRCLLRLRVRVERGTG
jgi:hypothetical protein